jgi:Bacterial Ig domain/Carbohydrate binding module (family 35)/Secretion system C-terminal sorting domain/Cellulase (glycosyl hydrolase family 5)
MKFFTFLLLASVILFSQSVFSQSRIEYNNQSLFLSGANMAWVNFAGDIGPGQTDFNRFADVMLQMHDHGGNALRLWLHTNGTSTPEFDSSGYVIGPGTNAIQDLKAILDTAWRREIGVDLCLWSFDMLRSSNAANVLERNRLMLTDTNYTRAYINNCLIPMVDSLKGHPAIITWEIFNEPEGMSNQFGWSDIQHVDMSDIQRFINLCSGAIHRTDTSAQVTSGSWSFLALTDVPAALAKTGKQLSQFSPSEKEDIATQFRQRYRSSMSTDEVINYLGKIAKVTAYNYYSDNRLIAAGGDPDGTLDFFSVHYYTTILPGNPTSISPFHHPESYWQLDKPIVVGEFAMQNTVGIPKEKLFDTLYQSGYAGALPWSWTDENFSTADDMLAGMQFMWDNYRSDVDVNGISGDWPFITITSPTNNTIVSDTSAIEITADAYDNDGNVVKVEFFANDTLKIGERDTIPYSITWTNVANGYYSLTAVATDNDGNQRTSNKVNIQVGSLTTTRLEAESAQFSGTGITVKSDPNASNGHYLDMAAQTGTVTWTLPNVPQAGTYHVTFGYRCAYDSPKNQYINVNGTRIGELVFEGSTTQWLEKDTLVDLVQGQNTIQMELSWGWMQVDYLSVPSDIVLAVKDNSNIPQTYSLQQNYPNPFNPSTTIRYQIPKAGFVKLRVFDILGNEVATLVNEYKSPNNYEAKFDASRFASGVYFYQLTVNNFVSIKKMILLK